MSESSDLDLEGFVQISKRQLSQVLRNIIFAMAEGFVSDCRR